MMTDNEIIEGLEAYITIFDSAYLKESLDLINRQKAEIERLSKAIKVLNIMEEQEDKKIEKAKSEAIRKFAEKVKAVTYNYYDEDIDIIAKEMEKQNDC